MTDTAETAGAADAAAVIPLYKAEREAESTFDTSKIAFSEIDRTSSYHFRKLLLFPDIDATWDHGKVRYGFALLIRYRTDWVPSGYGLGDMIYSVSLMPNEELTLEVKTWETETYSREEGSSTEETQTTDVSAKQSYSSEVMDDVTVKLAASVDATGEVSFPAGSAQASVSVSGEYTDHTTATTTQMKDYATQCANEMKTARTVKMTVSRETGREEKTTRKIRNINQTRTLSLNYYQVLQQYEITTYLTEVSLVLLGEQFEPTKATESDFVVSRPQSLANRYASPTAAAMINSFLTYNLRSDRRETQRTPLFRNLLLRYVTPLPNVSTTPLPPPVHDPEASASEPVFRYVFRVHPGRESELLDHFAGYAPPVLSKARANIVSLLESAQANVGQPVGEPWKVTLPTLGIYSEALLGRISGAEDYIEINRQFDLELKQLEVERLKLELERLRLLNQRLEQNLPTSELVVTSPGAASLTLNVSADGSSSSGETRQIKVGTE